LLSGIAQPKRAWIPCKHDLSVGKMRGSDEPVTGERDKAVRSYTFNTHGLPFSSAATRSSDFSSIGRTTSSRWLSMRLPNWSRPRAVWIGHYGDSV